MQIFSDENLASTLKNEFTRVYVQQYLCNILLEQCIINSWIYIQWPGCLQPYLFANGLECRCQKS